MPKPAKITPFSILLAASVLAVPLHAEQISGPQGGLGDPLKSMEDATPQTQPPSKSAAPSKAAPSGAPNPQSQSQAPAPTIHGLPDLMAGEWRTVDGAETLRLHRQLSKEMPALFAEQLADVRQFRALPLPFYDGTKLLEISARGQNGQLIQVHVLLTPKGNQLLDGFSPVIHDLNATGILHLDTAKQAAAYLRFFCGAVFGQEGPFSIIEQADQVWLAQGAPATLRSQIAGKLSPLEIKPDPEGGWLVQAVVFYSNALFIGDFRVRRNGMVEMLNDEPIMADLPIRRVGYKDKARQEICKDKDCPRLPE